jgi:hypothetical protein
VNVDDAIALVQEKDKRSIRCQCPDCDAQTALVAEVLKLRKHLRHAVEVCSCPDCWRKRHGGPPGHLTGKHMVVHVPEEAERLVDTEAAEIKAALQEAGLSQHKPAEAIKILSDEESRLSAELRERDRPEER